MITEDYVSFEVAKLLKEKGFDSEGVSEVGGYYIDYNRDSHQIGLATESLMLNKDLEENEYLRPTLQMAMKWLREVHRLFIFISTWAMLEDSIQYYFEIREIKTHDFETLYDYTSKELNSFEKVAEAAIKYCLENLI
jgi:hypothetical protein